MGAALKLVADKAAAPVPVGAPARSLLRFITCGSVDDGKSTLLGRLLFETGSVFEDQQESLSRDSRRFGTTGSEPDYALLVDGLAAEREQGITIDVAYRYFATPRRSFIAADTPGHEQYTRNMATGASTADVAIILIDARKGVLPQTRRHSYIVSMLGVRRVIVAVNKMDLVGYDERVFEAIEREYRALARVLGFADVHVLPLSAVKGDNIVAPSQKTPWYRGPSLLDLLETIETSSHGDLAFRMPVQWVNRPSSDFRGFAGTLASGSIRVGEAIRVLPRGQTSRIARIVGPSGDIGEAVAGQSVTLVLSDEIDISRGDVILRAEARERAVTNLSVQVLALAPAGLAPGRNYLVKIGTALVAGRITGFQHGVDVHDYAQKPVASLSLNGIGVASLRLESPVAASAYGAARDLGSLILIDPVSNDTVGLGVVDAIEAVVPQRRIGDYVGALKPGLVRLHVVSPEADELTVLRYLSWRAISALAIFAIVTGVTGSVVYGIAGMLADVLLRMLLGGLHQRWFERLAADRDEALRFGVDGGGI